MIKELKELLKNSTPTPWCYEMTGEKSNDWCLGTAFNPDTGEQASGLIQYGDGFEPVDLICSHENANSFTDAKLIVHAINALPDLIDAFELLEQASAIVWNDGEYNSNSQTAQISNKIKDIVRKLNPIKRKNNMFKDITLTPQPMYTAPKDKPIHCWTEYGFGLCKFNWDDESESDWVTVYHEYSVNPIAWVEMPTGVEMKLIEAVILDKLSIKPRPAGELLEHRALYIYSTQEIRYAINNLLQQGLGNYSEKSMKILDKVGKSCR